MVLEMGLANIGELEKYITCIRECSLRHLEALAMIGFVERVEVVDCVDKKNFKKVVAYLLNGKTVESACFFHEEVRQSLTIINIYVGRARAEGAKEKMIIATGREEM